MNLTHVTQTEVLTSCNSCKQLGLAAVDMSCNEQKLLLVSRMKFIRSILLKFSAHVTGITFE